MTDALHQHLMRAHGVHGVVNAFGPPLRLTFNAVERRRMDHGGGRTGPGFRRIQCRNNLRRARRSRTKGTVTVLPWSFRVIADDDPGTRNGVLAQFHASPRKTEAWNGVNRAHAILCERNIDPPAKAS